MESSTTAGSPDLLLMILLFLKHLTSLSTLENETKMLTEGNLETKEDNTLIISNVVLLGENALQLIL